MAPTSARCLPAALTHRNVSSHAPPQLGDGKHALQLPPLGEPLTLARIDVIDLDHGDTPSGAAKQPAATKPSAAPALETLSRVESTEAEQPAVATASKGEGEASMWDWVRRALATVTLGPNAGKAPAQQAPALQGELTLKAAAAAAEDEAAVAAATVAVGTDVAANTATAKAAGKRRRYLQVCMHADTHAHGHGHAHIIWTCAGCVWTCGSSHHVVPVNMHACVMTQLAAYLPEAIKLRVVPTATAPTAIWPHGLLDNPTGDREDHSSHEEAPSSTSKKKGGGGKGSGRGGRKGAVDGPGGGGGGGKASGNAQAAQRAKNAPADQPLVPPFQMYTFGGTDTGGKRDYILGERSAREHAVDVAIAGLGHMGLYHNAQFKLHAYGVAGAACIARRPMYPRHVAEFMPHWDPAVITAGLASGGLLSGRLSQRYAGSARVLGAGEGELANVLIRGRSAINRVRAPECPTPEASWNGLRGPLSPSPSPSPHSKLLGRLAWASETGFG